MAPYGEYAARYLEAGFAPIPARGKRTIKNAHHGRGKPWVTEEEVADWAGRYPGANIAARLPRDVIGLDVDAYDGKPGKETLRDLEEELGPLPKTVMSTSRGDGVSGIRLFQIPQNYWSVIWPGKAGPGIEIIWMGNRYIMAWPSIHPDTDAEYRWFRQNGSGLRPLRSVPDLDELPALPAAWCDYFARPESDDELAEVSDTVAWLRKHGSGEMCPMMATTVSAALAAMSGGAHDAMRDGILAICRDAARGHPGAWAASKRVFAAFNDEIGARTPARKAKARGECARSLDGAVRRAAAISPEAKGDPCAETAGLAEVRPIRHTGRVRSFATVKREQARWLWPGYLAFQCVTLLDADPSQGKSVTTIDIAARATRGRPFPGQEESACGPVNVLILAPEDPAASVMLPRLEAAGADMERVFCEEFDVKLDRRGNLKVPGLYLPDSAQILGHMVRECSAQLLIIDPITSFLGENVKSHVDASVRSALTPLAIMLQQQECACIMTRHFNKNKDLAALYRGGGSVAFVAASRVALVSAWLPDTEGAEFGIAITKNNYMPKSFKDQTLTGQIVDSDIPFDEYGTMTPKVKWGEIINMPADQLLATGAGKHGPEPMVQAEIRELLTELFERRDSWPAREIEAILSRQGFSPKNNSVKKVKRELGIVSRQPRRRGIIGEAPWYWTTNPAKFRVMHAVQTGQGVG